MFKFNNGNGAIICNDCGKVIENNLTFNEYKTISSNFDLCDDCIKNYTLVDNFDLIESIMTFENKDEFYFVQIIQRKKDGNVTQIGSNGYRTIKTYYIFNKDQFLTKKNKIKELCLSNNARAYIHINKRNAKEVALNAIQQYAKLVSEDNSYQGYRVWDSSCGSTRAKGYKPLWIVDVDSKDEKYITKIHKLINECRGIESDKIKYIIPTLNGHHFITIGFDLQQFQQKLALENLDSIDIQKDNPTLLYYARKNG